MSNIRKLWPQQPDPRPPKGVQARPGHRGGGEGAHWKRKKEVSNLIYDVSSQSGAIDPDSAIGVYGVQIFSPSSRLTLGFSVLWETMTSNRPDEYWTFNAGCVWSARAVTRNPESGIFSPHWGNTLFTGRALPDGWEMASAANRVDIEASIYTPIEAMTPTPFNSRWVVVAQWEPAVPMPDEELDRLFADCEIRVGAGVALADVGSVQGS